ncbi:MAG: hypothetical protein AAGD06_22340, partial [Acidobacteriota bacterium]
MGWMLLMLGLATPEHAAAQLPTPTLSSPSNGASGVSTTPFLDWGTVLGATVYRVFVHRSRTTLENIGPTQTSCSGCAVNTTTSSSRYTVPSSLRLSTSTRYYWMVRAGSSTAGSPNSSIWSFTTEAGSLPPPTLSSP